MSPGLISDPAAPTRDEEIERALEAADSRPRKPHIARVRYTHDAMIDIIVMRPSVSQGELAATFGFTEGWVSTVVNSDAFQARLEQRKAELVDPTIRLSLQERFNAVVVRSLEVLQEKLAKDPSAIPDNLALRAAEMGAKALGAGGYAPPPPPTDHLSTLASRLLALQGSHMPRNPEILDVEVSYPQSLPAEESRAA